MKLLKFRTLSLVFAFAGFLSGDAFPQELSMTQRNELLRGVTRIHYEREEGHDLVVGHGTAFGIDLDAYGKPGRRYLLSAAHNVIDKAGKPYPMLKIEIVQGGRTKGAQCKVVSVDRGLDVCLLESDEDLPSVASLATSDECVKAPVILAGSPRGIPVQLFDGTLLRRFHDGTVHSLAALEFDHGCSGGPLFSAETGKVVGLAVAGLPKGGDMDHTMGLFVPVSAIENFISPLPRMTIQSAPRRETVAANSVSTKAEVVAEVQQTAALTFLSPYDFGKETTDDGRYVVHPGDTLYTIAHDFHMTAQQLMSLNNLVDAGSLKVGRSIRIR